MPAELQIVLANFSLLDIRLSTTRVPVFDKAMQLPQNGYQGLGHPRSCLDSSQKTSILSIDLRSELPDMQSWKAQLTAQGTHLSHHFILILFVNQIPPASSQSYQQTPAFLTGPQQYMHQYPMPLPAAPPISPTSALAALGHTAWSSDNPIFSELLQMSASPSSRETSPLYGSHSSESSPSTPYEFTPPSTSTSSWRPSLQPDSGSQLPSLSLNASADSPGISDHLSLMLVPGMSVLRALTTAGVSSIQQHDAICVKQGSLWSLHKNHTDVTAILTTMGLSVSVVSRRLTYLGGLELSASEVLRHLKWKSDRTYKNKTPAYQKAKDFARTRRWHGPAPLETSKDFEDYQTWLGIVAMFQPNGFCYRDSPPQADSADVHERYAATLLQSAVLLQLQKLRSLTQPITNEAD
ncbi:hypothetical protein FB451DRAFT_1400892 [Mycena latifolia]|nr:hypothetical protein FB451DRAFT_1400892 [Mycena latifolia]